MSAIAKPPNESSAIRSPQTVPRYPPCQRLQRLSWARLLLCLGELDQALRVVDQLIQTAPNATGARSLPWLALTRGQALLALDRFEEAEPDFVAARSGALDSGYRHLLWRADLALGRTLNESGRSHDARPRLDEALAVTMEITATLPTEAQRQTFLSSIQRQFPTLLGPAPTTSTLTALSPRETEVLRRVAVGLTDAEVGAELSISRRTVGRHLESIYNKLGVSSRTAATALAYEHGLMARPNRR